MPAAYEIADAMKYAAAYEEFILFHFLHQQKISQFTVVNYFIFFARKIFHYISPITQTFFDFTSHFPSDMFFTLSIVMVMDIM